jgi:membrane fusion protein (multidrug efflux system)
LLGWIVLAWWTAVPACVGHEAANAPAPPTVLVDPVRAKKVLQTEEAVALVDGYVNAELRARVSGYLKAQTYQDGAHVKRGQLLFTIDPEEYVAQVASARGDLARARAAHRLGQAQLQRQSELVKQQASSAEMYDQAVAAVADAAGQETAAQAALRQAELNLSYTRVRSPVTGVAGIAQVRIGNLVGKDSPTLLTTVSQVHPMRVRFSVSEVEYLRYAKRYRELAGRDLAWAERQFAALRERGQTEEGLPGVELVLADGSVYPQRGVIIAADREIDPATATIRLEALFPNHEELLRPGQYGRVRLERPESAGEPALVVAEKALVEVQGTYSLAVVGADDVVRLRPVKVGARVGTERVIEQGVAAGERVVVEGVQKVHDGTKVTPKPVSAHASRAPARGPLEAELAREANAAAERR